MKKLAVLHPGAAVPVYRIVGSRNRPTQRPALSLKHYLRGEPIAPPSISYAPNAAKSIVQMFGNDVHGDCIYAMAAHYLGVITGNAGKEDVAKLSQVLADYGAVTGFNPNDPSTDQGGEIPDALAYYGKPGSKTSLLLAGTAAVDMSDPVEARLACWLGEGLWFGAELPDAWISPFPSANGFVWDKAGKPNDQNGHAFCCTGYDTSSFEIVSWGLLGRLTDAAARTYLVSKVYGEAHIVISPQMIAKGKTLLPSGLDWAALEADLAELAGGPAPAPTPTPVPVPTPPAPVVDPALEKAVSALRAGWSLVAST